MSSEVTYETNHISVLHDTTMTSALKFCFVIFWCYLKEKKSY